MVVRAVLNLGPTNLTTDDLSTAEVRPDSAIVLQYPLAFYSLIQKQPVLGILDDPLKTGDQILSCDRTTSDDGPLMRFNGIELQTLHRVVRQRSSS